MTTTIFKTLQATSFQKIKSAAQCNSLRYIAGKKTKKVYDIKNSVTKIVKERGTRRQKTTIVKACGKLPRKQKTKCDSKTHEATTKKCGKMQ